jgi:hypothetical protein
MVKKFSFMICLMCALCSNILSAQGKFGAGFMFGEPTGIAWKYRLSQTNALDGGLGFSPFNRYRLQVDYLWESYPFHNQNITLHYGIGAGIAFGRTDYIDYQRRYASFSRTNDVGFAARVPVGLSYFVPKSPLDIFVEVAPLIIFTSPAGLGLDGGLGIRFYF